MHWHEDSPIQEQAAPHGTDLGNARRMARRHGEHRDLPPLGPLARLGRPRWVLTTRPGGPASQDTVASIYAGALAGQPATGAPGKHALRRAANKLQAMIELARSEPGIPVVPASWTRAHGPDRRTRRAFAPETRPRPRTVHRLRPGTC